MIHRMKLTIGLALAGVFAVGASLYAQSKPGPGGELPGPRSAEETPAEARTVVRAYHVADLVTLHPSRPAAEAGEGGGPAIQVERGQVDFGPLVDLITESVAPGTWVGADPETVKEASIDPGEGTITPFFLNLSLIIRHSPEVHDQVVARLRQIRRIVGAATGAPEEEEERLGIPAVPVPDHPAVQDAPEGDGPRTETLGEDGPDSDDIEPYTVTRMVPKTETVYRNRTVQEPYTVTRMVPKTETVYRVVPESRVREPVGPGVETAPAEGDPAAEARPTPTTDDRIDALERKLDAVLEELRALREDGDG